MRKISLLLFLAATFLALPVHASSMQRGKPTRSDVCGECHKDIYKMWKASAHSQSAEDPIFLNAHRETERREGAAVASICMGCHAPSAALLKDSKLEQKVTWEGVNCDICHGITDVEMTDQGPRLSFDIGDVKRGPIPDAESMAHEVAYSELHTQALICAPCHEYANAEGTLIMGTYSEWQRSPAAAEGKSCQHCHMGKTKADVVDPRVMRAPDAQVNLHEVPGGHSITQLNKALVVGIDPKRSGENLQLDISLKNTGAGHSVPTGMPGRRVVLDLTVRTSDGKRYEEQKSYGETFADASGELIDCDSGYFARGVNLTADTRIAAGEQRTESFHFPVSPQATAFIGLRLHYEHSPLGTKENRTWITFYTSERVVAPESGGGR